MSYLIDRQAVIDLLKQMRKDGDMVPWEGKDVFARIRKLPTIQPEKAQLSQEGTTSDFPEPTRIISETRAIPSDDDRVSLSERVTATFYDDEYEEWSQKTVTVRDVLDAVCDEYTVLPPAQPEPHEGHWIWVAGDLECSKCHTRYPDLYPDYDNSVACPHCGAKMTK